MTEPSQSVRQTEQRPSERPRQMVPAVRIAALLGIIIAVASTLIAFPSFLPWMLFGWLLGHTALVIRGRSGLTPLLVAALILPVKGIDWSWWAILFVVVLAAAIVWKVVPAPRSATLGRRLNWLVVVGVWTAWLVFSIGSWSSVHSQRRPEYHPTRPIVCLGDSLTAFGYPDELAKLVTCPVIDMGADGITSEEGRRRLPAVLAAKPQAVVVELGGHDFLKGRSRDETKEHLQHIIATCRAAGAEIVLVEIPRGFVRDPYRGLERELARENDLELVPDTPIRRFVLWSPHAPPGMWLPAERRLSDDGLHPNARGNQLIARYVADALERIYGPAVRASNVQNSLSAGRSVERLTQ